jgi:tetratricopeptide (TPR) repeat protein
MQKNTNASICLAIIVQDDASAIQRCLLSVKPFIDTWKIYCVGSSENTTELIRSTLADVPGQIEFTGAGNFKANQNKLVLAASKRADIVILLEADEEFQSLTDRISIPAAFDTGVVNINHLEYTRRTPRIFRSSALTHLHNSTDKNVTLESLHNSTPLEDISIKSDNGPAHDGSPLYASAVSNKVKLAQQALISNQPQAALQYFYSAIDTPENSAEYWIASYLAANTQLAQGEFAAAIDLYQRCFESDIDRAEPLMRLAEIHHQHAEHQAAHDLCKVIIDMPLPENVDYFEPKIYAHSASQLLAETNLVLNKTEPLLEDKPQALTNRTPTTTADSQTSLPLTIGMATFDDYDGVYFSIMSIVLYHQDCLDHLEILVIDNNPTSEHGKSVKGLCERVSQARYVAAGEYKGTAVRERIFAEARGELVLCMDCHVFLHNGVVAGLLKYAKDHAGSRDLMHGPLFYDNHESYSTHMEPIWNQGFYGTWGTDERGKNIDDEPFDIPLQGMGLFACFKQHWLGFNHRFRGFGGEEGYIHEKFRQHGGRVLCLPFLRWTHRFDRPDGVKYSNIWEDRIRNYLIGWHELDLNRKPVLEHFAELRGLDVAASTNAAFLRETRSPLWHFDTVYLLTQSEEQNQKIRADLEILSIDKLIQDIAEFKDIPSLLRSAAARKLANIIIIDARDDSPSNIHMQLLELVKNDHTDVVIQSIRNTNSENGSPYRAYLINSNAFASIENCIESYNDISEELLQTLQGATSVLNINH